MSEEGSDIVAVSVRRGAGFLRSAGASVWNVRERGVKVLLWKAAWQRRAAARPSLWLLRLFVWNPLRLLLLAALYTIHPIMPVKFILMGEARIGQVAQITDFYLRGRYNSRKPVPRGLLVGIAGAPSNEQLITMFKRKMPIIRNKYVSAFLAGYILRRSPFVGEFPHPMTQHDLELCNTEPVLTFTELEEARGKRLLNDLGIPDGAWFVCFHAREPAAFVRHWPQWVHQEGEVIYCSIANFFDAMKYVTSCGGYAVRMGAEVSEPLPDLGDPRIIDYAWHHRSDFGDIYLAARCKFFTGSWSGLVQVSPIFNVPIVQTNMLTSPYRSSGHRDMMIFKPVWSEEMGRLLTFKEILGSRISEFITTREYVQAGLRVQDNTPQDILAATREMNERLDGTFVSTEADEELHRRFHAMWRPGHVLYETPPNVGTEYLRKHQQLLD